MSNTIKSLELLKHHTDEFLTKIIEGNYKIIFKVIIE